VQQDKQREMAFFDHLAQTQEYNVFTEAANTKICDTLQKLLLLKEGSHVVDLGCGSGVFTQLLSQRGIQCMGLDLSAHLLLLGKRQAPHLHFLQADVEALPFEDNSIDNILLSCLIHHLPSPMLSIKEVYRVLKPKGRFVAFDPNRMNPFMYLYRDRSSPFYSSKGVTPNERPVLPGQMKSLFQNVGFDVKLAYVDGLSFRYVASSAKGLLPIYNFFDKVFFKPSWLRYFRAFVFTYGVKP
jgi:ubiquinone/menaquinone biosynthesis C-methylase UbiE